MQTTESRDLLPVIIEQKAAILPDGCDSWAIKSVHPDLRTRGGFQWASPGGASRSDHNLDRTNTDACPTREGDGLCVATTWEGMASGGIPARTLLLVAYQSSDVFGRDDKQGKLRIAGPVHVVSIVDGERLVREHGFGANLAGADLYGADLSGANLSEACLAGANLHGACLAGACLAGAYLYRVDLTRADLSGVDLSGVDLSGANLSGVDLTGVDLTGVDLSGANLSWANLTRVDLTGVDLTGVDLTGACLAGVDLRGVRGLDLPSGWTLTDAGMAVWS